MKLYVQAALGLMLAISATEAKFGGGYVGARMHAAFSRSKHNIPSVQSISEELLEKMGVALPAKADSQVKIETRNGVELRFFNGVLGYGQMLTNNVYWGGELNGGAAFSTKGFIYDFSVIAKSGYVFNDSIMMYIGGGLGMTSFEGSKGDTLETFGHLATTAGIDFKWNWIMAGPFVNFNIALKDMSEFKYNFSVGIKLDFVYEF